MKQLKDFTDKELEQVGKKWVHPTKNTVRYYLSPMNIINEHGYIFGFSRQEESIFIDSQYKYWIEDGEVKSSLPFNNHKKKHIIPAIANNLYKMLSDDKEE